MPLAKLKPVIETDRTPVTRRTLAADLEGIASAASPARSLQRRLQASAGIIARVDRWPLGNSAVLIVTISLALWMALLTTATQLLRAIA